MNPRSPIRIGTRGSALALRQADTVRVRLEALGHAVRLVVVETQGDRDPGPFRHMQGRGFFTKAVQEALLDGQADLAVHSYKDLPSEPTPGLKVVAVSDRADARDTLLVRPEHFAADNRRLPLRQGARVGTGSIRRRKQLLGLRGDLDVADLRGNVPTRIDRLRAGAYDAIVVAAAGLERLDPDLSDLEVIALHPRVFVPAPAQGALALEAPKRNRALAQLLTELHDPIAYKAVAAERRLMSMFQGGCQLALGAYATVNRSLVTLCAWYEGVGVIVEHPSPQRVATLAFEALGGGDPAPVPDERS